MGETLRDSIGQRGPFTCREQEAFLNLVRTTAELADRLDRVLRPAGLSAAQYNVLRILRGAEPEGLCRNEVRDRMLTRMPDMTRLLDRMEAAGLVVRSRSAEDRRQVRTRISATGLEALAGLDDAVVDEHRRSLGSLDATELQTLIELLSRLRDPG